MDKQSEINLIDRLISLLEKARSRGQLLAARDPKLMCTDKPLTDGEIREVCDGFSKILPDLPKREELT